jgi:hypothetical protein
MDKDRSSVWKVPTADLGRAQAHAPGPDALASPLGPELKNASACVQGSTKRIRKDLALRKRATSLLPP